MSRSSTGPIDTINLDGVVFEPAKIEGNQSVLDNTNFEIVKASWQPDNAVSSCPICKCKFGGLKRRHHCRQCGRVACNKCCYEKIPLPQLGIQEPEKVCEACRPVVSLVTKSRSTLPNFQFTAAKELSEMCKNSQMLPNIFQLGGFHTLLALGKNHISTDNEKILGFVMKGLHNLSTYEPVQNYMVSAGVIQALVQHISPSISKASNVDLIGWILEKIQPDQEEILLDGLSALMIFCKSPVFIQKVLSTGALSTVLSLCSNPSDTVSLLAVSSLSLMVEHPGTHSAIVDGNRQALQRLLGLAAAQDEQMQAMALKCLTYLSMGTDWNKHCIVQEDFTAGRPVKAAIRTQTSNMQVLANAACLIANLATSAEDQTSLAELIDCLVDILRSEVGNLDLLIHVTRGLTNFARFKQNSSKLGSLLPLIVTKCLKHPEPVVMKHAQRAILYLLVNDPVSTTQTLLRDGVGEMLQNLVTSAGMMAAMLGVLLQELPDIAKPL